MPDIVQHIDREARKEKKQKYTGYHFFLRADLPTSQIKEKQHDHSDSAINVWPVIQPDLRLDISNMARKHIKDRKILREGLWKRRTSRCRWLQGKNLRQKHNRRQTSRQKRITRKLKQASDKFFKCHLLLQNQKRNHIEDEEHAGHDRDIIIGKDRKSKKKAVCHSLSLFDQMLKRQHNQWEDHDTVEPHDIPAVRRHISWQCIKNAEKYDSKILRLAVMSQIIGHAPTAESDFYDNRDRHKFNHILCRTEKNQPV